MTGPSRAAWKASLEAVRAEHPDAAEALSHVVDVAERAYRASLEPLGPEVSPTALRLLARLALVQTLLTWEGMRARPSLRVG